MSNRTNSGTLPLALPAPASSDTSIHIDVNESSKMKLDALGPLVVNSDGTLSRIANWPSMAEPERERIMRVLVTRNQVRIAKQEAAQNGTEDPLSIVEAPLPPEQT